MLNMKRLMTQYMPGMLTCEEVDHFLYRFHEGTLSVTENIKFKIHLGLCKSCKTYVDNYKSTIRFSQTGIKKAEPIENIPEELVQVILKSRQQKTLDNKYDK